ncbi:hypothetical protein ISF_07894 [Cordyceps fumosorosea ARSEF 2679]|uniref:Uncharacterized protein n=1 Tax=Cordyceps fumosorosea (strain ARSEF 2679) TaxID=1081104 RepID=A0A167NC98_CORFA|nr:hypothetical protein ISF_07894 [Cordyceps fumosorosea ARSEF 2679]OAA55383.1 hypothetical protein ISF_07894 [Cordyceps fumosorosea ARSEF 2679]
MGQQLALGALSDADATEGVYATPPMQLDEARSVARRAPKPPLQASRPEREEAKGNDLHHEPGDDDCLPSVPLVDVLATRHDRARHLRPETGDVDHNEEFRGKLAHQHEIFHIEDPRDATRGHEDAGSKKGRRGQDQQVLDDEGQCSSHVIV